MNSQCSSQRISDCHLPDQSAEFGRNGWSDVARTFRLESRAQNLQTRSRCQQTTVPAERKSGRDANGSKPGQPTQNNRSRYASTGCVRFVLYAASCSRKDLDIDSLVPRA